MPTSPPLEKDIEAKFVKLLKKYGFKVVKMNLLGNRSYPDRMVLLPEGRAVFVEFKRPKLGKLSAGQEQTISELKELGYPVLVATDSDEAALWVLKQKYSLGIPHGC